MSAAALCWLRTWTFTFYVDVFGALNDLGCHPTMPHSFHWCEDKISEVVPSTKMRKRSSLQILASVINYWPLRTPALSASCCDGASLLCCAAALASEAHPLSGADPLSVGDTCDKIAGRCGGPHWRNTSQKVTNTVICRQSWTRNTKFAKTCETPKSKSRQQLKSGGKTKRSLKLGPWTNPHARNYPSENAHTRPDLYYKPLQKG